MNLRRIIGTALSGVVVAGLTVALAPAANALEYNPHQLTWSYVDSAAPGSTFTQPQDANIPVGARVYASGTKHILKSYVTFDLSGVPDNKVISAALHAQERSVADCSKSRATQAWLTGTKDNPTWNRQPNRQLELPAPTVERACGSGDLTWDASAALSKALAAGRTTATFELTVPDDQLADPAYQRTYYPYLQLDVNINEPPGKPLTLSVEYNNCAATPKYVPSRTPRLAAGVYDPDQSSEQLDAQFQWWPAKHPKQTHDLHVTGVSSVMSVTIPQGALTEGTEYTWRVRGSDSAAAGPWSDTCSFVPDATSPATAPRVTSADYPSETTGPGHGGIGVPGMFRFAPAGVPDIVGYYYLTDPNSSYHYVAANRLGGPADVEIVPDHAGATELVAFGVDRAGNRSPDANYDFWVVDTKPDLACTPETAYIGQPRTCTVATHLADTTGFAYSIDDGTEVTVPADANGGATFTFTPRTSDYGYTQVQVRATTADGKRSDPAEVSLHTDGATPTLDLPEQPVVVGTSFQVTMHATLPGSTTFGYEWDGETATVPVGADGSATVELTADYAGYYNFRAYSEDGSGIQSWTAEGFVEVTSNAPTVASDDYPEYSYGGGVGVPGTFTFHSPAPGAASFTYRLGDGASSTVPADADGASVVVTPTASDGQDLFVSTTFADGTVSEETDYVFFVTPAESLVRRVAT